MKKPLSIVLVLLLTFAGFAAEKSSKWEILKGCTLVKNEYNDGDSFHVMNGGKEYVIRLYFVDSPETDDRFQDRVQAQADYFGISVSNAIRVGKDAAALTRKVLTQPFDVTTRFQNAAGESKLGRLYGIVSVGGTDLGEMLVSNGLARIHGVNVGGIGEEKVERLRKIEDGAKKRKAGAWGMTKVKP